MKRSYTPVRSKPVEQTEKNVNKEPTEEEKQFYKKLKNRQSALESRRKAKEKLARLESSVIELEKEQKLLLAENKRLVSLAKQSKSPDSAGCSSPVSAVEVEASPPPPKQYKSEWSNPAAFGFSAPPLQPFYYPPGFTAPTMPPSAPNPSASYLPFTPSTAPTYSSTPPQLFTEMLNERPPNQVRPDLEFDDFLSGLMQL